MSIPPPPQDAPEPLDGADPYPTEGQAHTSPQKPNRRRDRRHDPVSFAAGIVCGVGLALIVINIIAEVWL